MRFFSAGNPTSLQSHSLTSIIGMWMRTVYYYYNRRLRTEKTVVMRVLIAIMSILRLILRLKVTF